MKKLRIEKDSMSVYDIEHVTKPVLLLKNIGRYCANPECKKHLFGRFNQKYCSNKCKWKINALKNPPNDKKILHANFNLESHGVKNKYRIVTFYLKRGISQKIKITPESKELWAFLDKIENFRKVVITQ